MTNLVEKDEHVLRAQEEISELKDEQIRKAITVVPMDSKQFICCTYREKGY